MALFLTVQVNHCFAVGVEDSFEVSTSKQTDLSRAIQSFEILTIGEAFGAVAQFAPAVRAIARHRWRGSDCRSKNCSQLAPGNQVYLRLPPVRCCIPLSRVGTSSHSPCTHSRHRVSPRKSGNTLRPSTVSGIDAPATLSKVGITSISPMGASMTCEGSKPKSSEGGSLAL